jgi:hypothetical protein
MLDKAEFGYRTTKRRKNFGSKPLDFAAHLFLSYLVVAVLLEDVPAQVAHREEVVAQLTFNLK